jgi:hypothetical protein
MLIRGRRAPSPDRAWMVDCGDDRTRRVDGDEVVLIGRQGNDEITARDRCGDWIDTVGNTLRSGSSGRLYERGGN